MKYRNRNEGVTILEAILAMAVASSILMLGLRQYQAYKKDTDVEQVMYNVNQVFEAASLFYQANCKRQINPGTMTAVANTGKLDPDNATTPTNPYPVTIATLISDGYLTQTLVPNPLVNQNGINNGYVVQFNVMSPIPDRTLTLASGSTAKLGQIILWRVQVAVELKSSTSATAYKNVLLADCLSTYDAATLTVTPCSQVTVVPTSGVIYAVWERLPSLAVPENSSGYWMTNAMIKIFNQQYETKSTEYLAGLPTSYYPQQNYLCGG